MNDMRDNPLFSVLIANYNNGKYLMDAIESVKAQTYTNWEIIIVDDGSTDNSPELYKQLKQDSRIHVFYNEDNKGCGYTKRRCAELANGEICGFLDPDDALAEKDAMVIMMRKQIENPQVALVYSDYCIADETLNVVNYAKNGDVLESESILETASWPVFHWVTFKKSYYDKTQGIDPIMRRAVDVDLYYKLEEVGGVMHIAGFLYYYRINSGSISMNDNMYKSHVWHSYSCINAMKRRGLFEERLMLFPVEYDLRAEFEKGKKQIQETKAYKVGRLLLYPFKMVKRVLITIVKTRS